MLKNRIAHCGCGETKIEVLGNPDAVAVCSCLECQRRTGSVIGVSAYFSRAAIVSKSADTSEYTRVSEGGKRVDAFFCQSCGTTVWWEADFLTDHIGIAVGCFADPEFPQPLISVWEKTKHRWLKFSWPALSCEEQTPTWFNKIVLAFSLPKLTHYLLSVFSFLKKHDKPIKEDECVLTKVETILINRE
ncbi:MAG: GFA family protein [Gammaproteobacteria bacterium]|jgi:hypothetical protein